MGDEFDAFMSEQPTGGDDFSSFLGGGDDLNSFAPETVTSAPEQQQPQFEQNDLQIDNTPVNILDAPVIQQPIASLGGGFGADSKDLFEEDNSILR